VISAASKDGKAVHVGDTLYAGDAVTLTESVGTIPTVKGLSVDDATAALTAAKLTVGPTPVEKFSTSIAQGLVIGIDGGKSIHPGDTVSLIVSKGPELITVPDLTGKSIAAGRDALVALGFDVNVISDIPAKHWSQSWTTVVRTDPASGTTAPKGSTIDLYGGAN
jgi:serine/threonine-protein kinase